jgi:hypothetical protein
MDKTRDFQRMASSATALLCQIAPFIRGERMINYGFHLIDHHLQLGDGIFRIRRDAQTIIFVYHELMAGS